MGPYRLVAGGYRPTYVSLCFDPSTSQLTVEKESRAPKRAAWIELPHQRLKTGDGGIVAYSLEEDPDGALVSLNIKPGGEVIVSSKRRTFGSPSHVHCMKDGSGIVAANYIVGSVVYFPTEPDGTISSTSTSPLLKLPFAYDGGIGPFPSRQDASYAHHIIEDASGKLYVCDLGSDRVYVIQREGESGLAILGWLQCPPGSGPRHAVLSPQDDRIYVLGEMGHHISLFYLGEQTYPLHPDSNFNANIIPPIVPIAHQYWMDSAEIIWNPVYPNVLYASNRWQMHIKEMNPGLPELPLTPHKGDAVAIVLLSDDGRQVQLVKHVYTEVDLIRAMQVSPDGKFVALAGQEGGGIEIWKIGGTRGDEWTLAARNRTVTSVCDFVWL